MWFNSNCEFKKVSIILNERNEFYCKNCPQAKVCQVFIPYACKLLIQELMAMHLAPRIITSVSV